MNRKSLVALATLLSVFLGSTVAYAHGGDSHNGAKPTQAPLRELRQVKRATDRFHSVRKVERAGYEEFLECFDSDEGGMGQHYVDVSALDGTVDPKHPEAMVHEVRRNGQLKLVAAGYIVPSPFVDPADPPSLFGQDFNLNAALDVWVLHAWIWKKNPAGMFADWNPRVRGRPSP